MKAKILLFFLILFIGCGVSKTPINVFETIKDKEYAGVVIYSTIIEIPLDNFTLINTDINSIPVRGKVKIKEGTKCYYYYIKDKYGKEIAMFIWDGATKGYELR